MALRGLRTILAARRYYFDGLPGLQGCRPMTQLALIHRQQQPFTNHADTQQEVAHLAKQATNWWDVDGPMKPLHALNAIRVPFIRDGIVTRGSVEKDLINTDRVLKGQRILECGCGGGILTEQLARLGADVTGIDLGDDLIRCARDHLQRHSPELSDRVAYKAESIEVHAATHQERYDAIVLSEVLEHVTDKVQFLSANLRALRPGGSIFITTMSKTLPMWFGGIVLGENLLNLAPKGTHHWDKLISPLDVQRILDTMDCQTVLVNGSTYDFVRNRWLWINCTTFCYALQAIKTEIKSQC